MLCPGAKCELEGFQNHIDLKFRFNKGSSMVKSPSGLIDIRPSLHLARIIPKLNELSTPPTGGTAMPLSADKISPHQIGLGTLLTSFTTCLDARMISSESR